MVAGLGAGGALMKVNGSCELLSAARFESKSIPESSTSTGSGSSPTGPAPLAAEPTR